MNAPDVLTAFLKAYAAKDLDTLAPLLADDVHLQDWNLAVQGKAAVLAETAKNFRDAATLSLDVRQLYAGPACAAAQVHIVVDGHIELDVVDTIVLNADGLISAIRAYKG